MAKNALAIAKRLEQYREENGLAEGEEIPYQEGLFAKDELDAGNGKYPMGMLKLDGMSTSPEVLCEAVFDDTPGYFLSNAVVVARGDEGNATDEGKLPFSEVLEKLNTHLLKLGLEAQVMD